MKSQCLYDNHDSPWGYLGYYIFKWASVVSQLNNWIPSAGFMTSQPVLSQSGSGMRHSESSVMWKLEVWWCNQDNMTLSQHFDIFFLLQIVLRWSHTSSHTCSAWCVCVLLVLSQVSRRPAPEKNKPSPPDVDAGAQESACRSNSDRVESDFYSNTWQVWAHAFQ